MLIFLSFFFFLFLLHSVAKLKTSSGFNFVLGEVTNICCKITYLGFQKVISNAAAAEEAKWCCTTFVMERDCADVPHVPCQVCSWIYENKHWLRHFHRKTNEKCWSTWDLQPKLKTLQTVKVNCKFYHTGLYLSICLAMLSCVLCEHHQFHVWLFFGNVLNRIHLQSSFIHDEVHVKMTIMRFEL